jgi:hypothetical protein
MPPASNKSSTPPDKCYGLVIVAAPLNPFETQNAVVIKTPGESDMEMVIKKGNEMKRYQSSGKIGEGQGTKAGTAYRLKDGNMIDVPEAGEAKQTGGRAP